MQYFVANGFYVTVHGLKHVTIIGRRVFQSVFGRGNVATAARANIKELATCFAFFSSFNGAAD